MKNAIIGLAKGGNSSWNDHYAALVTRNKSIYECINSEGQYPLLIFHEGNITKEHQTYIQTQTPNQKIEFISVEDTWGGIPYTSMCKFFYYDVWHYCKDYDWVLRVDTDIIIRHSEYDIFEKCTSPTVFVAPYLWWENHTETVNTLVPFLEEITGVSRDIFWSDPRDDTALSHNQPSLDSIQRNTPNSCYYPFWVVGATKPSFWLREEIQKVLLEIINNEDSRTNRWGDLPVLGSLLMIFGQGKNQKFFRRLQYRHISHTHEFNSENLDNWIHTPVFYCNGGMGHLTIKDVCMVLFGMVYLLLNRILLKLTLTLTNKLEVTK